jgi:hypothetical protein
MRIAGLTIIVTLLAAILISGCTSNSISTGKEDLSTASKSWIPFAGDESITFIFDTSTMVFTGTGREAFYETVRYKTDQSGFFSFQTDYYAELERQRVTFESPSTTYSLSYLLAKNKAETGDWELLSVTISDDQYYSNQLRIITYETDEFNKGENFKFQEMMTLNGMRFNDVYYRQQERRPFEIYYTKLQGIVAFRITSDQLWVINDHQAEEKISPLTN